MLLVAAVGEVVAVLVLLARMVKMRVWREKKRVQVRFDCCLLCLACVL